MANNCCDIREAGLSLGNDPTPNQFLVQKGSTEILVQCLFTEWSLHYCININAYISTSSCLSHYQHWHWLLYYLLFFFCSCDRIPNQKQLQEAEFTLVHSLRRRSCLTITAVLNHLWSQQGYCTLYMRRERKAGKLWKMQEDKATPHPGSGWSLFISEAITPAQWHMHKAIFPSQL